MRHAVVGIDEFADPGLDDADARGGHDGSDVGVEEEEDFL